MSLRRQGSNADDLISQMSDDVLLKILSFLPIKNAVATSSLSTRWRFLWSNSTQLNFDASEVLHKISKKQKLCFSESDKYVNQVNNVIRRYNHPTVHDFRVRFHIYDQGVINEWLQFAINKKVEFLEVDAIDRSCLKIPLGLFERRHLLKKLMLKKIDVTDDNIVEIVANCPHLETISIHSSYRLRTIRVGGRALNLKHIEIVDCVRMNSIYLSDFDLVSFTCKFFNGWQIDLHFTQLPKLKQLDIHGIKGMENNVLSDISSCALFLEALSISIYHPERHNEPQFSLPELSNVKKLRLTICGIKYQCLVYLAHILNACPNLDTFTLELVHADFFLEWTVHDVEDWSYDIESMRKTKLPVSIHPLKRLKLLQIVDYNIEIAPFIIQNAVELKKIVFGCGSKSGKKAIYKRQEAARSYSKQHLESLMPQGAELVIL
ncbi:F-box domain containing protein [Tanacetum coccineum]